MAELSPAPAIQRFKRFNCKHNVMNGERGTRERPSFSPYYTSQLRGLTLAENIIEIL